MDGKLVVASLLLAGLMMTSGLAVYFASQMDDGTDDNTDDSTNNGLDETTQGNRAPTLYVAEASFLYGEPIIISGWVVDESFNTTTVSIQVFSQDSLSTPAIVDEVTADGKGVWAITLPYEEPDTWVVEVVATDAQGLSSSSEMVGVELLPPNEEVVRLTIRYVSPEVNNSIGLLVGDLIHLFPGTCTVEFWPEGQSALEGVVNGVNATYTIPVDEEDVSHSGVLWATCGLFDVAAANFSYQLPIVEELPEDEVTDSDGDGIVDADDECPNSPDEPVWPDGCTDSQLDSDEDGVTDDLDLCPDTGVGFSVDANGCADNQKDADGDGISDAGDQCANTPITEVADASGCSDSQKDQDGDGVQDSLDQCPNTLPGTIVDSVGCEVNEYDKTDSWVCTGGNGPWVKDFNEEYYGSNRANNNGVSSAGGGGSGPWFQCEVSFSEQNNKMVMESNGIPNHDFLSTLGCCADEMDYTAYITMNPVNDTTGGHSSTNCPAAAGRWECAPDRGAVAIGVNGVPIYGPEEGPGGDAVALHFDYFNEDRQPIELGWCAGHSAGPNGYHYHYDANCIYWEPETGEDMSDYSLSKIPSDQHSPIVGWAFDGYPIYGMYGYGADGQTIRTISSSYVIERTQDGGDQGYNGIDDWNYVDGVGDLDECNGRFGPTPEFPEGIYHYVSTPVSGSPTSVTDTNGNTVGMIGFPYFLICYHGVADVSGQSLGGGQGPPGPGRSYEFNGEVLGHHAVYVEHPIEDKTVPMLVDLTVTLTLIALVFAGWGSIRRK
ncbi:MAG TPA: YHYH protein [Candidatus Poseidoniales archaeon]|nr:YHYH protein [Candidatus Poseidoniales archaeon]